VGIAHEIIQNGTATIRVPLATRLNAATASASWLDRSANSTSLTATIDDSSASVSSVSGDHSLTLSSLDPMGSQSTADWYKYAPGRQYVLLNPEETTRGQLVTVATADASTNVITIVEAIAASDTTGLAVYGGHVEVSIPASLTTKRGMNFRVRTTATFTEGASLLATPDETIQEMIHIVAQPTNAIVDLESCLRLLEAWHPSAATSWPVAKVRAVADLADIRVKQAIQGLKRYPHLYGGASWFQAGVYALRFVLSDYGLAPRDADLGTYQLEMDEMMRREVDSASLTLSWYDDDDDDVVEEIEEARQSIRVIL
jgi:hypothetical protein